MKDSRERFTETVDNYEKYRPSYPAELIDWIVAGLPARARVADLGCGTGISTRLLAARGLDVVGIDPNEEMLNRAIAAGGANYRQGEAAATGLPDAGVDLITGGQAFHWFDLDRAFPEFRRILRAGGRCAAFWNVRFAGEPFQDEYEAILRRHSSEYDKVGAHDDAVGRIRARPDIREAREAAFPNRQKLDFVGLLGRAWSSSYVVHGVKDKAAFDGDLRRAFDRHERNGVIEIAYRTEAIAWALTPPRSPADSA